MHTLSSATEESFNLFLNDCAVIYKYVGFSLSFEVDSYMYMYSRLLGSGSLKAITAHPNTNSPD